MSYDPIEMRGAIRKACQRNGRLECVWCGGIISGSFDPHHALVKSSTARHPAVDEAVENRVPIHRSCHSEHEGDPELKVRGLNYLIDRLGAKRIACWYISLWRVHGLSVTPGTLPRHVTEQDWREYLELVILPLCFAA